MRLLLPLMFVGCATEGADSIPTPDVQMPALDLNLTGGLTEKDHTEVGPGMFLSTDVFESGEIRYVDLALPPESMRDPEGMFGLTDPEPETSAVMGGYTYCYNYATDYGQDTTRYGDLFGGPTSWYNYLSVYSYDYEAPGYGADSHIDAVSVYASTSAGAIVDYVYAYVYYYVNGRYAGYSMQYTSASRSAYAYGYLETDCRTGTLEVDAYVSNYVYEMNGPMLSVTDKLHTSVVCCPD